MCLATDCKRWSEDHLLLAMCTASGPQSLQLVAMGKKDRKSQTRTTASLEGPRRWVGGSFRCSLLRSREGFTGREERVNLPHQRVLHCKLHMSLSLALSFTHRGRGACFSACVRHPPIISLLWLVLPAEEEHSEQRQCFRRSCPALQ